jgi:hypothetical protein
MTSGLHVGTLVQGERVVQPASTLLRIGRFFRIEGCGNRREEKGEQFPSLGVGYTDGDDAEYRTARAHSLLIGVWCSGSAAS